MCFEWPPGTICVLFSVFFGEMTALKGAHAACADVGLVLAIDASSSVSAEEFVLQKSGYVSALADPEVRAAFSHAGVVDLAVVFCADSGFGARVIPWHRIHSASDLSTVAARLEDVGRPVRGNTDIGVGIDAAIELFTEDGRCAERRLLDISGDGRAPLLSGREAQFGLAGARKRALDLGITINGLAILDKEPSLGTYYRRHVAGGMGSFVIDVEGQHSFAKALRQKLRRELFALEGAD